MAIAMVYKGNENLEEKKFKKKNCRKNWKKYGWMFKCFVWDIQNVLMMDVQPYKVKTPSLDYLLNHIFTFLMDFLVKVLYKNLIWLFN